MKQFKKVAVGGTFDELHRGHKTLLEKAFEVGEKVVIGLSSDEFVSQMAKPHQTAPYGERYKELEVWLNQSGLTKRSEIVPLNDPFGLTITGKGLEALIVSQETEKIAERINEKREKAGAPKLCIIVVNMVPAENCTPISTTRIRRGVAFRTVIMPFLDFGVLYHFLLPLVLSRSFTEVYMVGLLPGMFLFNLTVPLYTIPISYFVAKRVNKSLRLSGSQQGILPAYRK